jgi:transglutaminase-like putative cysteine protease
VTETATLYDVTLSVLQTYEKPALSGRHLLRLVPASLPGEQDIVVSALTIRPDPDDRRDFRDFFGNGAVETAFGKPHDSIEFRMTARVRRLARRQRSAASSLLDALPGELAAVRSLDPTAPHHFLAASPHVPKTPAISAYARKVATARRGTQEIAEALGRALHADMRFDAKATTVDTPIAEAFANRHGVCQDFSHIMIAGLRSLGIPAGYVSGFLRTNPPKGRPRLQGADATHAWVRFWCGREGGWAEYDPTNAVFAGDDHIVIARGRDYFDVAPVKGVLRTAGAQSSKHSVDVIRVGAAD